MHDSSACPVCKGLVGEGSLSDEQFSEFLEACRAEVASKQETFERRIHDEARWSYDMARMSLRIGRQRFGMTPVGTFSAERRSWLWAWANEDFPGPARHASARIQSLHQVTGFRVFVTPGLPASSRDAQDFAAFAVHALEAIGFFRCPSEGGPDLYLAVHERREPIDAAR